MKMAGYVVKIDKLGRIVIPKQIRDQLELILDESRLELYTDNDGIVMKNYIPKCTFCSNTDDLTDFKDKYICKNCLKELNP